MTAMNFIDPTFHGATFPATYIAPGFLQALGVSATQGSTTGTVPAGLTYAANTYTLIVGNVLNSPSGAVSGYVSSGGNLTVIPVGFSPRRVVVFNETGGVMYEWMYGMTAGHALVTTLSGPTEADTAARIVVTKDAAGGQGDTAYVEISATIMGSSTNLVTFMIEP